MDLESFVRASGVAMGLARDSFGLGGGVGAGGGSLSGSLPLLAGGVFGSGAAATAASTESNVVDGQVLALGQQNVAANAHLESALTAVAAGRAQVDGVISAAVADINRLAAATTTFQGKLALMASMLNHLQNTGQTLTNGSTNASTCAACSGQLAAGYNGLGNFQGGGMGATSPASFTSAVSPMSTMAPMGAMSQMQTMQTMPMLAAQSMAANQAVQSQAQQAASTQQRNGNGRNGRFRVGNHPKINVVISRAMGQRGVPYSWGGGTPHGPSVGFDSGANTIGFDCSSFVRYAYWPFVHLPRTADLQMHVGRLVARSDIRPGDLIFSEFGEEGPGTGAGHVQMAVGYGPSSRVISAAHTGTRIHIGPIESGHVVVKRLLGLR